MGAGAGGRGRRGGGNEGRGRRTEGDENALGVDEDAPVGGHSHAASVTHISVSTAGVSLSLRRSARRPCEGDAIRGTMAAAMAGRVVGGGAPVTSASSDVGVRGMKLGASSSCWAQQQPRAGLVANSVFLGNFVAVDRFVLRAVNGSSPRAVGSVVNEVAVEGSVNNASTKLEVPVTQDKPAQSQSSIATAASVFMADVANLIKLVDTRDIVELELKQKDYELIIRKKEALPPPPAPQQSTQGPHVMAHTMFPGYQLQGQPQEQSQPVQAAPAPAPAPAAPAPVPDAIPLAAEHPPMLSPMAGTFYKCPGPGEPPYVKVGDKVTKGQVVCIVEAMKLMNEIEADQSGTVVEILAEDGKPVSMESPLYVIKP